MDNNPNIERAAKVLCESANSYSPDYPLGTGDQMATRIDSAGLLLTPLHEKALDLWQEYAQDCNGNPYGFEAHPNSCLGKGLAVGRASLALKEKAKGYYTRRPHPKGYEGCYYESRENEVFYVVPGREQRIATFPDAAGTAGWARARNYVLMLSSSVLAAALNEGDES